VPVPASVEFSADQVRLTITRTATNPFLSRHDLRLTLVGPGGCSIEVALFPIRGMRADGISIKRERVCLYVVGQFDARVIDPLHCTITLAEFRTLDRYVTFIGSFDENEQERWTYFPPVSGQNSPLKSGNRVLQSAERISGGGGRVSA